MSERVTSIKGLTQVEKDYRKRLLFGARPLISEPDISAMGQC